jgi:hypothetical protein
MTRVVSMVMLTVAALAAPLDAEARSPSNIPRIGFLTAAPLSVMAARTEAFRQGLRELGYVEMPTAAAGPRWRAGPVAARPSVAPRFVV